MTERSQLADRNRWHSTIEIVGLEVALSVADALGGYLVSNTLIREQNVCFHLIKSEAHDERSGPKRRMVSSF